MKNPLDQLLAVSGLKGALLVCLWTVLLLDMPAALHAAPAGRAGIKKASIAESAPKVNWQRDLQSSLDSAQKDHKLVLVDVYTPWCSWCKRLDRDTYSDPGVAAMLNNQFVCLKLDAEDGGQGQAFARQHRVRGYPCIIVLDVDGSVRGTIYGYRSPRDFSDLVKGMVGNGSSGPK